MKQFTRILALVVVLVLAMGLIACGETASSEQPEATNAPESTANGSEEVAAFDFSAGLNEDGGWADVDITKLVTLPENYLSIPLSEEAKTVTQEEVDAMIEDILASSSTEFEKITDQEVKSGDRVSIDYVGSVDGVEFMGGNTNGQGTVVTAGSKEYVDDFLDQIIGHKPGETVDVVVTFPEGYNDSTDTEGNAMVLAGKEALFQTTINYIQGEQILPELSDDWVKVHFGPGSANDMGLTTVEELHKAVEEDLLSASKADFVQLWVEENCIVNEVPEEIFQRYMDRFAEGNRQQAASYGMTVEQFYEMMGTNEEQFMESQKENIRQAAELELVLQAIAEAEGMQVTEEQVRTELGPQADQILKIFGLPYAKQVLRNESVMMAVMDGAQ